MRLIAAVPALLLLAGCAGNGEGARDSEPDATPTPVVELKASVMVVGVNGMAIIEESLDGAASTACDDQGGEYAALGVGEQIKLLDAQGDVVSVADLEESLMKPPKNVCAWEATFSDVPAGGRFYSASIGKWESKAVAEDDLDSTRLLIDTTPE